MTASPHLHINALGWEEIVSRLPSQERPSSLVTFYRNRNGWCPYSQRVWMALEHKRIPYDVCTISSKDTPQWYKDIVPTKKVPSIELHDAKWNPAVPGSGKLVWDSMAIIKALDVFFPENEPKLSQNSDLEPEMLELTNAFEDAAICYVFDVGQPLASLALRRDNFTAALTRLDAALARSDGPFACGAGLSAADLALLPFVERYSIQAPTRKARRF